MKFIAAWVRRNIDNKPDYISYHQYTIGYPVLYNTYDDALDKAKSICSDTSRACYSPAVIPIKN